MSAKEKKSKNSELEAEKIIEPQPEVSMDADLSQELRATVDRLQRLQAEFENYKKRALRDAAVQEQRVMDRIILDFLPLYDNLERAFQSLSADGDIESFVSGIELVFGQFNQVLEGKGVAAIEALGKPFDPELHEAMLSVSSDAEKNVIVEEFIPGYTRDERVLRPSRVAVSQGPALSEEEPQ